MPSRTVGPPREASLVKRMGVGEFSMGDLNVSLCLVELTPEKSEQSGVHKTGRPASFPFAPSDAFQYRTLQKIPSAWCAAFDGSAYEHFLDHEEFRSGYCAIAGFFKQCGMAVQVHNSVRYPEVTCRICRAISDGTLGHDVGCWLFQLVFTQAGWVLLDAVMTAAAEGTPAFVARSPDGTAISKEWLTRMCRLMARKPGAQGKGKPLTRAEVRPTQGA